MKTGYCVTGYNLVEPMDDGPILDVCVNTRFAAYDILIEWCKANKPEDHRGLAVINYYNANGNWVRTVLTLDPLPDLSGWKLRQQKQGIIKSIINKLWKTLNK
jgi:hypothetical protein